MQAVRAAVLKRMRVGVSAWTQAPVFTTNAFRLFSAEAHGTYLDKHVVTDRILNIVKQMQKVDPAKVLSQREIHYYTALCNFLPSFTFQMSARMY